MGDSPLYQVKGWDEWFESAKSRSYRYKSQTYTPNKHGLGYRMLVKRPNGAALFGAWRAMTDVLSRHEKPRQGILTDTGRMDGTPIGPHELEALTDIPAEVFTEMLVAASSKAVGWITVIGNTDTTGIPQGQHADTPGEGKAVSDGEGKGKGEGKGSEGDARGSEGEKKEPRPESRDAASAYAKEIGFTDWEGWFDHFESNGWKVSGKAPMKDWKAAMRNGKRRQREINGGKPLDPCQDEARRVYEECSAAIWDAKARKVDKDEMRRVILVLRDKHRGCPRMSDGKDPVSAGVERGLNSERGTK